jgi:Ricin-type beta-trefoil lectin domain-like
MKTKFVFSTLFAFLAIGASIVPASVSAAALGQGFIVNSANGKCLDFAAGNLSNTVTLQQWPCGGNSAINQQWNFIFTGFYPNNSSSYLFQNAMNFTCAAVEGNSLANAARIVQRPCDASNPSQHWIQLTAGVLSSKTRWMNGRSAKCLDIWNTSNGTVFQQYTCAGSSSWPSQGFRADLFPIGGP